LKLDETIQYIYLQIFRNFHHTYHFISQLWNSLRWFSAFKFAKLLLPQSQVIRRFEFSRYIICYALRYILCLDSRYIVKAMYLEKQKRLIIWNWVLPKERFYVAIKDVMMIKYDLTNNLTAGDLMMCLSTLGAFGSRTDSCKSTAWTKLLMN